ncbi:MAG: PIN domain-containing protein [Defluviitaleaceae bacterium]|nr:PIN domain-containing protein [Defluviitaleaceae bacterium]
MIFALDTNIISYLLRNDGAVTSRWISERNKGNKTIILLMVYYEVKRGLLAANATKKLRDFMALCELVGVDDFSRDDADTASRIYAELKSKGRMSEDSDILIAAQALSRGYTLVTNNVKHFKEIDGLVFENWTD